MLKSNDPDEARDELEEMIEETKLMIGQVPPFSLFIDMIDIEYGVDDEYVKLGVNVNIEMVKDIVKKSIENVEQIFSD